MPDTTTLICMMNNHQSCAFDEAYGSLFFPCSKFVPRGSVRVSNVVAGSSLEAVAFLTPDKQVVVILMNTGDQPITFKLLDVLGSSKQAVKITALAHSIQTFLYY